MYTHSTLTPTTTHACVHTACLPPPPHMHIYTYIPLPHKCIYSQHAFSHHYTCTCTHSMLTPTTTHACIHDRKWRVQNCKFPQDHAYPSPRAAKQTGRQGGAQVFAAGSHVVLATTLDFLLSWHVSSPTYRQLPGNFEDNSLLVYDSQTEWHFSSSFSTVSVTWKHQSHFTFSGKQVSTLSPFQHPLFSLFTCQADR